MSEGKVVDGDGQAIEKYGQRSQARACGTPGRLLGRDKCPIKDLAICLLWDVDLQLPHPFPSLKILVNSSKLTKIKANTSPAVGLA